MRDTMACSYSEVVRGHLLLTKGFRYRSIPPRHLQHQHQHRADNNSSNNTIAITAICHFADKAIMVG